MARHGNLFDDFGTKGEVYDKLQSDYDRDARACGRYLAACAVFLGAAGFVDSMTWKLCLLFVAAVLLLQYVVIFVDNSNRNYLMHAIDWIEAKDKPPG